MGYDDDDDADAIAWVVARRGERLLDRVQPDWRDKVDRERLCMSDGCDCILGQVYGDYNDGLIALDEEMRLGEQPVHASQYGFSTLDLPNHVGYPHLQDAWLEILAPEGAS